MFQKRLLPLAALGALLLTYAPATPAHDQPTRVELRPRDVKDSFGTYWFGVYFQNKKVGYFSSSFVRAGAGDAARLVESSEMSLKLTSLGQRAEMKSTSRTEFEARPPHRVLHAETSSSDGKTTQVIRLVARKDGYDVTITTNGQAQKKRLAALDFTLGDALATDVWLRQSRKAGDTITVRELDLEDLKTSLVTNKLLATKASLVAGVKVVYHEVDSLMHKANLQMLMRCDAKGRLISGKMGGLFEIRRESEEAAKNTQYSADVFVLGMVKIDKGIGEPTKVTGLVLEIPGKEGAFLKSASRQAVSAGPGGTVCKLGKAFARPVKATAKEIEDALAETTAYPISLPRVQELARRAVGDAEAPREKVKRLVKFVHDYIKPSLTTSMPKLQDLVERKQGDCKAYALLFNALARAAGIPSRELGGLLYMGDAAKSFGGHAWNEVVLDGHWVPVDASLNEPEADAAHVSFGSERESTRNLLDSLGKLSFRLVEVRRTP